VRIIFDGVLYSKFYGSNKYEHVVFHTVVLADEVDVISRQLHIYEEELNICSLCYKWHVIVSAGSSAGILSLKTRTKDLTLKAKAKDLTNDRKSTILNQGQSQYPCLLVGIWATLPSSGIM